MQTYYDTYIIQRQSHVTFKHVQRICRSYKSMKTSKKYEHHFNNLFLYPSRTIDSACTVSGNMLFRWHVMMWRALNALKCLSHSADDAGITISRFATQDSSGKRSSRSPHHCRGSNSPGEAQPGATSKSYFRISASTLSSTGTPTAAAGTFFLTAGLSGAALWNQSNGLIFLFLWSGSWISSDSSFTCSAGAGHSAVHNSKYKH